MYYNIFSNKNNIIMNNEEKNITNNDREFYPYLNFKATKCVLGASLYEKKLLKILKYICVNVLALSTRFPKTPEYSPNDYSLRLHFFLFLFIYFFNK